MAEINLSSTQRNRLDVTQCTPPDRELSDTSKNAVQNKVIKAALDAKVNTSDIDSTPTQGSGDPVSSGGVYTALSGKMDKVTGAGVVEIYGIADLSGDRYVISQKAEDGSESESVTVYPESVIEEKLANKTDRPGVYSNTSTTPIHSIGQTEDGYILYTNPLTSLTFMYDSWHDIEIIRDGKVSPQAGSDMFEQTITGNICESGDILAKDRLLPPAKHGDLACILDAGAYGFSMCSSYNSRPRPAEVLVKSDGKVVQIRRRETIEDLMRCF